jgi:SOS response regulatory protein OraA/RecX
VNILQKNIKTIEEIHRKLSAHPKSNQINQIINQVIIYQIQIRTQVQIMNQIPMKK